MLPGVRCLGRSLYPCPHPNEVYSHERISRRATRYHPARRGRLGIHLCRFNIKGLLLYAGNPKGVVLTHKNVLATVAALQTFVREVGLDLGSDDSTLSYLTLAHILGRALEEFALSVGASIGYWQVRSACGTLTSLGVC